MTFFGEFLGIYQISDATTAKRMKETSTSNYSNFWHAFTSRVFVSDSWAFLFYSQF